MAILTLTSSYAETFISGKTVKNIMVKGPTRIANVKANKVIIDGCLAFSNLDVKGDVTITCLICGDSSNLKCKNLAAAKSVIAKKIKCENMHICGSANLEDIEIAQNATIKGNAKIKGGKMKNLNLSSNEIHLQNVNVHDIIIEENPHNASKPQSLYLKDKTLVAGNINFKSGQGIIFLENNAIIKGEINGATINNPDAVDDEPEEVLNADKKQKTQVTEKV